MTAPNFTAIRRFLVSRYSEQILAKGLNPDLVSDDFDFLLEGVVDSFGVLELVASVEKEFGLELDLAGLDAESLTILGPLSRYMADQAAGHAETAP